MYRLTVDQGNSRTKLTVFENGKIIAHHAFHDDQLYPEILELTKKFTFHSCIISSVRDDSSLLFSQISQFTPTMILHHDLKFPFHISYASPKTLGTDRIANAAGAIHQFGDQNILIVDCGTCITYTLIVNRHLKGGAISPGIRIRLKALHEFTGKLPLVEFNQNWPELIGHSTEESILSGVLQGIVAETEKMIENFCSQIKNLNVIITGGNQPFFEPRLKSPIFAAPLLTPEGLHEILQLNEA